MNFAIIGAGEIARAMATTVNCLEEINLYAIASREKSRADLFASEFNVNKSFGLYEEMLMNDKIDLVYIATPHSHHFEHGMLCLEYGKNVLCEKAFTANRKQAEILIKKAEEKNLFISEAMWTRFMPLTKKLKELVDSKIIGEVRGVSANLNFPMMHKERLLRPELAGGALLDVGIYPITFASLILGDEIDKVNATGILSDNGVDLISNYAFTYKNGALADLNSGMCALSDGKGVIYGESGFIIVNGINNPFLVEVFDNQYQQIASYERPEQITGYEYEVKACVEAINMGKKECQEMPHNQTIKIMGILDEIRNKLGIIYPCD